MDDNKTEISYKEKKAILTVVARKSRLSLLQVEELFGQFPTLEYRLNTMDSMGDKNKKISLMENIAPDFFTRELDQALIGGQGDIAVHSAKDLPYPMNDRLEVIALLKASDKTDALVSKGNLSFADLPTGAKIGTSSCLRKSEVLKYRKDLEIVPIRGNIEERIKKVDEGKVDALIVATCALRRLGLEGRITDILPFKTHDLQGNLAVVALKGNRFLKDLFKDKDIRRSFGKVTLVGFGPGNPDLLTLGGNRALEKADLIYYDDLVDSDYVRNSYPGEKIYVGKRKGKHSRTQDEINELLYRSAVEGKNVVRLKGGDPMIFARGREEIDSLQSRMVEVEVIPGISAGIALSAYTRIPLTHRGIASSVAFATGHTVEKSKTPDADTLVYYMAGTEISRLSKKLILEGWKENTPVALVHNVSLKDQKTIFSSLAELKYSVVVYPTPVIIVIGEVVNFEHPQAPKTLLTGTSKKEYEKYGELVHLPLIRIDRIENNRKLESCFEEIRKFDYILFTSRYGVEFFFLSMDESGIGKDVLEGIEIFSVGRTTTSALSERCIFPSYESPTESADGLIRYFEENHIMGKRILLPRSEIGIPNLPEELKKMGNEVVDVPLYKNIFNRQALDKMDKKDICNFEKIIFTSPSTVKAFHALYGNFPSGTELIAKGETTEKELRNEI